MRGVRALVFVEDTPATRHRFVAIAALPQLRWALAQQFPWLDVAWSRAYIETVYPAYYGGTLPNNVVPMQDPRMYQMTPAPIESVNGALSSPNARSLVARFISLVQSDPLYTPPDPLAPPPPHPFEPAIFLKSQVWERTSWVTRQLLESLLPAEAFDLWTDEHRDLPRMRLTRSVLRRVGPFVALVRGDREYVRLVKRSVLLEEMASSLGEEHETR